MDPALVGDRLVELAYAARDFGGIEISHPITGLAGFRARNHQQRIEGADKRLRFFNRAFQRLPILRLVLCQPQHQIS